MATRSADDIKWFHRIELPGGYTTPGTDDSASKLELLHLPSLAGKSVLDVGAWDGFFSFTAERMGASRVVALDSRSWRDPGKEGFEYARSALGSQVEDVECEVLDISPETAGGTFDVVFFLGVLYHMRHPLLSLERVASVTNELLVLETVIDLTWLRRPAAAFYPGMFLGDPTNWWGPNKPAVIAMLEEVGFTRFDTFAAPRLRRLARSARSDAAPMVQAATERGSRVKLARDLMGHLLRNRLVVHAWR